MKTKKGKGNDTPICSKRHRQFELARKEIKKSPSNFYLSAARAASPPISAAQAVNDYGRHQLSLSQGKFTAPPYVHAHIDSTLGLAPKAQKADKPLRRKKRQRFTPRKGQGAFTELRV